MKCGLNLKTIGDLLCVIVVALAVVLFAAVAAQLPATRSLAGGGPLTSPPGRSGSAIGSKLNCRQPYIAAGFVAFPCGQCMPCRVNKRREWTHRIMLESKLQEDNSFLTLTYADDTLPTTASGLPTLAPPHLRDWLKRFRKAIEPVTIRFYAVGEYGDETFRPHYHAAIFGFPPCRWGNTRPNRNPCCDVCALVEQTWGYGKVFVGSLSDNSAQYIAGYVTKKMTAKDDTRLLDRHPEFARMSNRGGGIGSGMMDEVASTLMTLNLEERIADVPSALRTGSRLMPLGRYLRQNLRKKVGKSEKAPQSTLDEYTEALRPMREAAQNSRPGTRYDTFKEEILKSADQKVRQMETKQRIFKKGKTL